MAFPSDITLTGNSVTNTVSQISVQGSETIRRDAARGLATPYTMRISTASCKGTIGTDNAHLVRIDHTFAPDAAEPASTTTASVYVTIVRPQALADTTIITTMTSQLVGFLQASGNLAKLLNGES